MHNVLILNYRSLEGGKQTTATSSETEYAVTLADFEQQMTLLHSLKMPVVGLEEVVAHVKKRQRWHRHVVCITFENGDFPDFEAAVSILKQYHFPATFFLSVQNQHFVTEPKQWQELAAAGFSVGFNTVSQLDLTELPEAEMQRVLATSKQVMEQKTGTEIKFLAPFSGKYNQSLIRAAQAVGFQAMLTNDVGVNRYNADLFQLKTWTIKKKTSLKAFRRMVLRNPRELRLKQLRSRSLNLGSRFFSKLRSFLLKVKI